MEILTRDHNIVNLLVENGKISREDARIHPMRHMLTNYVRLEGAIPEIKRTFLEPGNRILICTDGLTGIISEKEIADVLMSENPEASKPMIFWYTDQEEAGTEYKVYRMTGANLASGFPHRHMEILMHNLLYPAF